VNVFLGTTGPVTSDPLEIPFRDRLSNATLAKICACASPSTWYCILAAYRLEYGILQSKTVVRERRLALESAYPDMVIVVSW
jgi:hypothetical protein